MVVAAIAAGLYARQRAQAKPLTDKDVLVLADFTNTTGDSVFDATLREALATKLEQSPFLKTMDDGQMRWDLGFMGRTAGEHITNDIAREICQREGDKAMIQGSIASLGKTYAIALHATNCKTGETLAREQVEAQDKEHVLRAISKAATSMRAKLGESLNSIQKLDHPLDQVTTSSLEAFQAYALGREQAYQGSNLAAIPFFQQATELDPNFAYGWLALANAYGNSGDANRSIEYTRKAYSLIDRVSERERLAISSRYFLFVTGERDKAMNAAVMLTRAYPRYFVGHNSLATLCRLGGDFEKALPESLESNRLIGVGSLELGAVIVNSMALDRLDEAKALAQKEIAEKRDPAWVHALLLRLAQIQGDRAAAEKEIQWFAGKPVEYQSLVGQAGNAYALAQHGGRESCGQVGRQEPTSILDFILQNSIPGRRPAPR